MTMHNKVSAEDRFGIHDLFMEYVWAADTGDLDNYVATFARDGLLMDSEGHSYHGHDAIRTYAANFLSASGRGRIHFFQQRSIKPDTLGIRVFSFWQVVQSTAEPRAACVRSVGTCDDLCSKIGGVWRFAERRISRWNDQAAPWNFPQP